MCAVVREKESVRAPDVDPSRETPRRRLRTIRLSGAFLPVAAAAGLLLYRLAPDVRGKPYYEDEAISGLIAMRPFSEVLETVLVDRGGAPLHFVLTHAVFRLDTSGEALRWLSVVAALAAIPLVFDLARRLAGLHAGYVAAAVAASSTGLAVYGSFGRMYALFVLASALFADLFVRAVQLRTRGAVIAAAAAGWLLPAVHPYGAIPAFVGLATAAVIWRGRPLRAAIPVGLAVVAAAPFFVADRRLADRAAVGAGEHSLASPGEAWGELVAAVSSFAGGDGLPLVFFAALAFVGTAVLTRRQPAFVALAASLVIPPVLFLLVRTDSTPDLSPRHLFYGLPLWAAAVGVGASRLTRSPLVLGLVALIAVTAPASALRDPRELGFATAAPGETRAVRAKQGDLLLPYASVFLASLENVRHALALPHAPGEEILDALEHAEEPIGSVYVAVPTPRWTVLVAEGPFGKEEALSAAALKLRQFEGRARLEEWLRWIEPGLCEALRTLDRPCP